MNPTDEFRWATDEIRRGLARAENALTLATKGGETKASELRAQVQSLKDTIRFMQRSTQRVRRIHHVPIHNSIKRRKFGIAERVFLSRWRQENRRVSGTNGGYGVLELLLSEHPNSVPAAITQRDAMIAATVIQWLGTNCGRAFVEECERKIKKKRDTVCEVCYRSFKDVESHLRKKHPNVAEMYLRNRERVREFRRKAETV